MSFREYDEYETLRVERESMADKDESRPAFDCSMLGYVDVEYNDRLLLVRRIDSLRPATLAELTAEMVRVKGAKLEERVDAVDMSMVNHPAHYGGKDNPYEAIKVIEACGLGFCAGNAVKYIARSKHKGSELQDLEKSRWYLHRAHSRDERRFGRMVPDYMTMTPTAIATTWSLCSELMQVLTYIMMFDCKKACTLLDDYLDKRR